MLNRKGQAFAEAVFIFPIMAVTIFSVIWFARVVLTWQQLVSGARYGTDMIANTSLSAADIKKDIENYLTNRMIDGRRLDKEKIKEIKIDINDYPRISFEISDLPGFFSNAAGLIKGFVVPGSDVSSVSITYSYDIPKLINFTGLKKFEIHVRSSVLSGSGCKNGIHKRTP